MKRIRVISLAVIAALSLTVTSFAAEKSPQQSAAAYLELSQIPSNLKRTAPFTAAFAALRMFRNGQKAMWATASQIIWLQGMAMDATAPMTLLLLRRPAR